MHRWLGAFVALACQAQQELPPDLAALVRIKAIMAEHLSQLPNYTCTEMVERSVRPTPYSQSFRLDNLRLNVEYADGKERYGLQGSPRIDQSLIKMMVDGTIGEGAFALIVKELFLGQGAEFHIEGDAELRGNSALLYSFRVPHWMSGYRITTPSGSGIAGYHGRFWVNQDSLDLMRIELSADDIPAVVQVDAASEWIDYGQVSIGDSTFLLPEASELRVSDTSGAEHQNVITYQACRQFSTQSDVSFTEIENTGLDLPQDFDVDISLESPIDSALSAVGDPVSARLLQSIKSDDRTVVPKGAGLSGYIKRFDHEHGVFSIELAFTSLDFKDAHAYLEGRSTEVFMRVTSSTLSASSPYGGRTAESTKVREKPLVFKSHRVKLPRGTRLVLHSSR